MEGLLPGMLEESHLSLSAMYTEINRPIVMSDEVPQKVNGRLGNTNRAQKSLRC